MWHTAAAVSHRPRLIEHEAETAVHALQGGEGGGHTGEIPTSMLIPAVMTASLVFCLQTAPFTIHAKDRTMTMHITVTIATLTS